MTTKKSTKKAAKPSAKKTSKPKVSAEEVELVTEYDYDASFSDEDKNLKKYFRLHYWQMTVFYFKKWLNLLFK